MTETKLKSRTVGIDVSQIQDTHGTPINVTGVTSAASSVVASITKQFFNDHDARRIIKRTPVLNAAFKTFCGDPKLAMPLVKLHYGPYFSNGILKHKSQRLYGLKACLTKLGYDVELNPTSLINRLEIEIMGREIHRINIKFLLFNMDCDDDSVCTRAVMKIEEATKRMYSSKNIPGERFITMTPSTISSEDNNVIISNNIYE